MSEYLMLDPKPSDLTMVRVVRREVVHTNVCVIPPGIYLSPSLLMGA